MKRDQIDVTLTAHFYGVVCLDIVLLDKSLESSRSELTFRSVVYISFALAINWIIFSKLHFQKACKRLFIGTWGRYFNPERKTCFYMLKIYVIVSSLDSFTALGIPLSQS